MSNMSLVKAIALPGGPILALLAGAALVANGFDTPAGIALGVAVLAFVWWVFEPIPIPATSLLPLALLPMLGVLPMSQTSQAYGNPLVLLLLGGFVLSTAMEKSGAHRRIALTMVKAFGGSSSRRLVFGFMAASAVLSMWISNTATTLMLLPVALAVLQQSDDPDLPIPLLLGIAYAASIGGIATPIGTPPNIVFMGAYSETTGEVISFPQWMAWALPIVLVFLPIVAWWLTRNLHAKSEVLIPPVGEWQPAEKRVLIVFVLTAIAWVTRGSPGGGWSALLSIPYTNDAMVAFIAVVSMFIIPDGKGGKLLDWESAEKIPWGMLILFGAGLAIAGAFEASGLSRAIGDGLSAIALWPTFAILIVVCLSVTFLTEATSNTATTTLLMPILAAAAIGAMIDPRLLMVPAAMSASCAFMLPVATAPNVIMFSTGRVPPQRMAREGFALNLIGAVIIATAIFILFG